MQKERFSLPAQEAMLREYAGQQGMTVVEHYQDAGLSAKDTNRPELQRLMRDVEAGKLDVVLSVELDRTTRNVEDMIALTRFFRQHHVEYRELDCEDTGIHTADGFLKRTIKSTISQYERMHTAERVKRTMRHRAMQGKWPGGTPPYGFTSRGTLVKELQKQGLTEGDAMTQAQEMCKEKGRLYPIPEEIAVVKRIFEEFLTSNSLRKTAHRLNADGYRTHTGGLWSAESLRRVLTHPVYLGRMVYGKTTMEAGERLTQEQDTWITAEADHDPVIPQEDFDQARALLNAHQKPRRTGRVYLLSGLVKCGLCGGAIVGWSRLKRGKRYSYYRCYRKEQHGQIACAGMRWNAEKLETFVIQELLTLIGDTQFLSDTEKHLAEMRTLLNTHTTTQDLEQLDRELRKNRRRLDVILEAYEDGVIDKTDFKARYQTLKDRLYTLETSRVRLQEQAEREGENLATMEASFTEILRFGDRWDELTPAAQQKRLQAVIDEIRVTHDHIDIDLIVEGWEVSQTDYRLPGGASFPRLPSEDSVTTGVSARRPSRFPDAITV